MARVCHNIYQLEISMKLNLQREVKEMYWKQVQELQIIMWILSRLWSRISIQYTWKKTKHFSFLWDEKQSK